MNDRKTHTALTGLERAHDKLILLSFRDQLRGGHPRSCYTTARAPLRLSKEQPPMSITRIGPSIQSRHPEATRAFYCDLIGMEVSMQEPPDFLGLSAPATPSAQIIVNDNGHEGLPPGMFIDVGTPERLREIHDLVTTQQLMMIAPLEDKPWGIRRFSVLDPNGVCVTILCHVEVLKTGARNGATSRSRSGARSIPRP